MSPFFFLKLIRGVATIEKKADILQDLPEGFCFPERCRLLVQADVIEQATGNKQSLVDKSCQFTSSPYVIEFKNTPKYFKPGLPFVVKVKSSLGDPVANSCGDLK